MGSFLGGTVREFTTHELAHSIDREIQSVRHYLYRNGFKEIYIGLNRFIIRNNVVVGIMNFFEEDFASYLGTKYRAYWYLGDSGNMSLAPLIFDCLKERKYELAAQISEALMNPFFNYFLFARKEPNSWINQVPQTANQLEQSLRKHHSFAFDSVCDYLSRPSQESPQDSFVSVAAIKRLNLNLYSNWSIDQNDIRVNIDA